MEIIIPEEKITKVLSADICVIGGSCTGVFAAVRAARLGAKVILVEKANRFGGVATCGLVGMWHSLFDMECQRQIIGGLTYEMLERLDRRGAVSGFRNPAESLEYGIRFNSEE
ncbi:MAG: FAD-dependent oxidoreductase, partial [Lentisphaeria bacterium]|nr:FAD-dependent oxidoreductase [Lentisphaeria bacterium]